MKHHDAPLHVRGTSRFIDDLPEPPDLLHAAAATSPVAHGRLIRLETTAAAQCDGVLAVLTAEHIPGANQVGGIIQDEPLFAHGEVHFTGQPMALVVACTSRQARRAAQRVTAEIEALPAIFDPRQAAAAGLLIAPSRTFSLGDVDSAWQTCDVIVEGRVASGGQEHLYLETQASLAEPLESGRIRLVSGTQAPTAVQRITARVLGVPMNAVEVEVTRLGGAFGGKEDQATPWAVMAALAAHRLQRPVKMVLGRHEDMRFTGKRHPYCSDFKMGLSKEGRILAYEATLYQNAGAAADLSTAILERSLFHVTNAYFVPNVRVTAMSCRTNLPPFTAFRGFGAPQAMFVFESAIHQAAESLQVPAHQIQRLNLLAEGDTFPYGMQVRDSNAQRSWDEAARRFTLEHLHQQAREFNTTHLRVKRGIAVMPVCFGISFTNTFLNQAGALVHVFTDGSVRVSTGAVEMGQGVNTKILAVAARTLGLDSGRFTIASTSTERVANTSPTAASSGADMNGKATELACQAILARLREVAADELGLPAEAITISDDEILANGEPCELSWLQLVWSAYTRRINLSAQAHYATPDLQFDRTTEKGKPFAYHVFGTAIIEVTVDGVRGTHTVDRVRIVHDAGSSLAPLIDRSQVEGGVVQGIGWMTMEELIYSDGRLVTDSLTTYKVPDIHAAPEIETVFLEDAANPHAVLSSKAIGEPPFMYGIGTYFAILDAMKAFRPDLRGFWKAPMTPEQVLMSLHGSRPEDRPESG